MRFLTGELNLASEWPCSIRPLQQKDTHRNRISLEPFYFYGNLIISHALKNNDLILSTNTYRLHAKIAKTIFTSQHEISSEKLVSRFNQGICLGREVHMESICWLYGGLFWYLYIVKPFQLQIADMTKFGLCRPWHWGGLNVDPHNNHWSWWKIWKLC